MKDYWNTVKAREEAETRLDQTRKIKQGLQLMMAYSDSLDVVFSGADFILERARTADDDAFTVLRDLVQRIEDQVPGSRISESRSEVSTQGVNPPPSSDPSET